MPNFFKFLYTHQSFLTFFLLESLCLFLIVQHNRYQRSYFLNKADAVTGTILKKSSEINDYFHLKKRNTALLEENKKLKELILEYNQRLILSSPKDSIKIELAKQYTLITARVINNSIHEFNNYLTISKGFDEGIRPGMSVLGTKGIVGKVKACSKHFSIVTSLLHRETMVSCEIKTNHAFGIMKWPGDDAGKATILYLPKHLSFKVGDTVVTSGYNAVFPPAILIGFIDNIKNSKNKPYYDITIKLSTDFSTLPYVYVVRNNLKKELTNLSNQLQDE